MILQEVVDSRAPGVKLVKENFSYPVWNNGSMKQLKANNGTSIICSYFPMVRFQGDLHEIGSILTQTNIYSHTPLFHNAATTYNEHLRTMSQNHSLLSWFNYKLFSMSFIHVQESLSAMETKILMRTTSKCNVDFPGQWSLLNRCITLKNVCSNSGIQF